jgi:hypothetical protein
MSPEEDAFWVPIGEAADVGKEEDLSSEGFAKYIEDLFSDWPNPQSDILFNILSPLPVITTPSSLPCWTVSDSEPTASQDSYGFTPLSDYTTPSDIVTQGAAERGFYSVHDSVYSEVISNHHPLSFGSLPPSPPLDSLKADSDCRTSNLYQPFFETSPQDLPLDLQQSANVVTPSIHSEPVQVTPDTHTQATPAKRFRCRLCSHGEANTY